MQIELKRYPAMHMEGLLPRDVWVWKPPGYETDPQARFPVLYMHDGQNLFSPEKAYKGVTWGVAETITKLTRWGFIRPAVVVGIDNTENRTGDYMPTRPFETPEGQAFLAALPEEAHTEIGKMDFVADRYLRLLVDKIKPRVDRDFRTLENRDNTIVMGSSMGGLISMYALNEYAEVFGGAGCFSTHWPAMDTLLAPYLKKHLPPAGQHKWYFDYGSAGLDAQYPPFQRQVDEIMGEKGYTHGEDWLTNVGAGASHHERAWRARLHVALRFFLGT